jgi:uncharacterized protein YdeI (BOF family)
MRILMAVLLMQLTGFSAVAAETFGTGDFSTPPVKLATLLQDFEQYKDKKVVISGEVKDVCKEEGCWLKIEDQKISVRTVMKNHGFKVPAAIKHKTVLVAGMLVQKELPASVVKHYLRDEGKSEAEINKVDKPQKVFQFIADAVQTE